MLPISGDVILVKSKLFRDEALPVRIPSSEETETSFVLTEPWSEKVGIVSPLLISLRDAYYS
jgi:hypothetical protein